MHHPESIEQVQELVNRLDRLKVLGTRHSFNSIADSSENFISLDQINKIVSLDREGQTVTVEAGVRYGELCQVLHQKGFAMHNLASLPHISVAGACATATHGSGVENGNLATAISALEIVTADGEIIGLSRQNEQFYGAVVALGGIGVVTKITLDVIPAFDMRQVVYQNLPLSQLEDGFNEIMSRAYSVSLFTDWGSDSFNQVWLKQRMLDDAAFEAVPEFYGATLAARHIHPIADLSAVHCTPQMGVIGPWHERLPHFRMDFTPSSGEELQSEYFVARRDAVAALGSINQIREQIAPLLLISEIRTIAADILWMSPCYRQDCVSIHFTWKQDWTGVQQVLPVIEAQLEPFNARPHWGKLFTMSPKLLQPLYERLPDFQKLLRHYDPQGKFRNAFLDRYIFEA